MDKRNTILLAMSEAGHEATMDVIRRYLVYNTKGRHEHLQTMIADNTIERADVDDGAYLTPDGRPVFWYANEPWVTKKEIHDQRLQEAFAQQEAFQEESKNDISSASFCLRIIDDTPCGGELLVKKVCPSSDLGRRGIKRISKCSVCETVSILEATEKFSKEIKNG